MDPWMRSPSENLAALLQRLQLCSRGDLEACERHVRRLCHDLPDFDTVWLDALIHRGILTPWQAEMLQSGNGDSIRIGRFHRRQLLGRATFEAASAQGSELVVLHSVKAGSGAVEEQAGHRLGQQIAELSSVRRGVPSSLMLPHEVLEDSLSGGSVVVSGFVSGWTLEELLIRGGRIPWQAVAEIGRDLLTALAWLESVRMLHGDVVLRNVRMTNSGRAILVDPFVRRSLHPVVALTEQLALRDCEGVAPEQIGSGRPADARSDLYSLGCLLWQLLAARPMVLNADPVARLMKIREHDIPDVRTFVPDCPEWMSRAIVSMTRRSPELRPTSTAELLKQWKSCSGTEFSSGSGIIRALPERRSRAIRPFRMKSRRRGVTGSFVRAASLSGLLILFAALVTGGTYLGWLPRVQTLSLSDRWFSKRPEAATERIPVLPTNSQLTEALVAKIPEIAPENALSQYPALPQPDNNGTIRLTPGTIYLAEDIRFDGSLQIIGASDLSNTENAASSGSEPSVPIAAIRVRRSHPWKIAANQVELTNVQISPLEPDPEQNQGTPGELIGVESRVLRIDGCLLQGQPVKGATGISWRPAMVPDGLTPVDVNSAAETSDDRDEAEDAEDPSDTSVVISNSVVASGGTGIRFYGTPVRCRLENVLIAAGVAGMRCDFGLSGDQEFTIECHRLTQRFSRSFVDVVVQNAEAQRVTLRVTGGESVVAPDLAVVRVASPDVWNRQQFQAEFLLPETGNGVIVPPDLPAVVFFDPKLRHYEESRSDQVIAESLLIAAPEFGSGGSSEPTEEDRGNDSRVVSQFSMQPLDSLLLNYEGPKLAVEMPGIIPSLIPAMPQDSATQP
jgi:serine/threonine protein kinase